MGIFLSSAAMVQDRQCITRPSDMQARPGEEMVSPKHESAAAFFALFHDKSPYLKVILSWNPGLQEVKINRRTAVLDPDFLVGWRHPTGAKLKLLFDTKKHKDSSCFSWNHECLRTEHL